LFVLQGFLFFGYDTVADRLRFGGPIDWRGVLGLILIAYALLIYAGLGYLLGHGWPKSPVFGALMKAQRT
jgi:Family of unknown function (DUF6064)